MKRTFIVFVLFASVLFAQSNHGIVKEGLKIKSDILGKEVRYTVYLPYDYNTSERYYPVVYLLHGYSDNDMGWLQFGEANALADEAIQKREIPPMILVMPDAGVSWYINNHDGTVRYEDFFVEEFIPFVEENYRIRKEKRYRGIAGLSMGGYGTLVLSLKHPDLFTACAAFSSAVYTEEDILGFDQRRWDNFEAVLFGSGLKGEERLTEHLLSNNIMSLLEESDMQKLKSVKYYIDCGDDDFLTNGNAALHIKMTKMGIPHEYRVRDGAHNWTYWRTGLIDGLRFIGQNFHQF